MNPVVALLSLLLPLAEVNRLWFALPLLVSISLVYSATRHEQMGPIVRHAAWFGAMVALVMVAVGAVLQVMIAVID